MLFSLKKSVQDFIPTPFIPVLALEGACPPAEGAVGSLSVELELSPSQSGSWPHTGWGPREHWERRLVPADSDAALGPPQEAGADAVSKSGHSPASA